MEFQIERAEQYYSQAMAQLPASDRKAQRPGLIMAAIYRATLEEIKAEGCLVLKQRTSLTPLRKLCLAGLTWVRGYSGDDPKKHPFTTPFTKGTKRINGLFDRGDFPEM